MAVAKEALWLIDQMECGGDTTPLLQVAALEAKNAHLTRRNQPGPSRHQVCGHLREAALLPPRDARLVCGSSPLSAEPAEMHVALNCCAAGASWVQAATLMSAVDAISFLDLLTVGCLQEATESERAASGEGTAVQELPGPSQSELSPARPKRPSLQDAHLSPQVQVGALGLEGCLIQPLPLAVHLCCSWRSMKQTTAPHTGCRHVSERVPASRRRAPFACTQRQLCSLQALPQGGSAEAAHRQILQCLCLA